MPGQPWACYRSTRYKEENIEKHLESRLSELLVPSPTPPQLKGIQKQDGRFYCPYLRLKQNKMDKDEWILDGNVHNGSHFPLCVFTSNARARSKEKAIERSKGRSKGGKQKGDNKRTSNAASSAAVAEQQWWGKSSGSGTRQSQWYSYETPPWRRE